MSLHYLPVAIPVTDTRVMIIGGSQEGIKKAKRLARFMDQVTFISPVIPEELRNLPFRFVKKEFDEEDLKGVKVLFACTADKERNHRIKRIAKDLGILTSVCDDLEYCDFISLAIFSNGKLSISVGSDGEDVRRSIRVRNRIKQLIDKGILDIT